MRSGEVEESVPNWRKLHRPLPASETNQVTAAYGVTVGQRCLGTAHVAQVADFVDAIRSDRPVRVGKKEARAVLAAVLCLYESAASGKPVLTASSERWRLNVGRS